MQVLFWIVCSILKYLTTKVVRSTPSPKRIGLEIDPKIEDSEPMSGTLLDDEPSDIDPVVTEPFPEFGPPKCHASEMAHYHFHSGIPPFPRHPNFSPTFEYVDIQVAWGAKFPDHDIYIHEQEFYNALHIALNWMLWQAQRACYHPAFLAPNGAPSPLIPEITRYIERTHRCEPNRIRCVKPQNISLELNTIMKMTLAEYVFQFGEDEDGCVTGLPPPFVSHLRDAVYEGDMPRIRNMFKVRELQGCGQDIFLQISDCWNMIVRLTIGIAVVRYQNRNLNEMVWS